MTTDITELALMKGQKVEGSYYLAECTDCGKMYPSNKLNGGEPLFSGDYGECYCPHCNADDAAIGDCGDTAAIAWNYQQGRIDALVEALEKAQVINAAAEKLVRCKGRYHSEQNYRALASLFGVTTPDLPPLEHENVHYADAAEMEIAALRQRIAELESSTVTVKLPPKDDVGAASTSAVTVKLPGWFVKDAIAVYDRDEVEEALTAAGIKWEAE
ncbi:TPA: ead/Ea22-like family protein [Raoultella terrigena]